MVLAAATGFLRGRLTTSARAVAIWRYLHGAAYGGWALAMLHGLRTGTDSGVGWVRWLYVGCLGVVAAALVARTVVVSPVGRRNAPRLGAGVAR